jgi:shikimate dehydrogenase
VILDGRSRLAGVFGWPVAHSRSPRLHGYWLEQYRINGAYLPLPVQPADFADAVRILPRLGFAGANVTLPHKEAARALADDVDAAAARIGAVNTLVFDADGGIRGSNTDAYGFRQNLVDGAADVEWRSGPAVVLGAGGAARAVLVALDEAGVPEIRLVNRTRTRAEALAAALVPGAAVVGWHDRGAALDGAALLVNTTVLGMTGQPPLDVALDALPTSALVTDLVYAPLETPLLAAARRRGNPVVDGLGMLLHQARPGFHAWFGVDPAVDEALHRFVAADLLPG